MRIILQEEPYLNSTQQGKREAAARGKQRTVVMWALLERSKVWWLGRHHHEINCSALLLTADVLEVEGDQITPLRQVLGGAE